MNERKLSNYTVVGTYVDHTRGGMRDRRILHVKVENAAKAYSEGFAQGCNNIIAVFEGHIVPVLA